MADDPKPAPARRADKGYHEKTWAGHPAYECDDCPYDSMDEDTVKRHVQSMQHPG